ncbi:hypothetical protein D2V93_10935 [Flagellimonas taeanensis]|uniref:Membrane metalloprotease n=1 Tax=Flagellimonas taeanensis TaxID=1005926 RepID=A0A1M6YZT0_9FLAO|nr:MULTISPECIES: hypothetical protein [Allomuricauda]MDC6386052.1 hypothetical protein [Muricauda sp. SK9]MEE1963723.1 hypothetical protein [Allomuricauda taeanensis]RIV50292.1 hypothetical protein D2V93_10935 [Allomuricauda taeanensis]SFC12792.1 hypothetical protein SAMN04487891_106101 [Allomuricauda taeanensis]SHL23801.1 hypothetical protein SAMN05216293_3019 [Allomuricauda taeanensis]
MKKKIALYSVLSLMLFLGCSKDSGNDPDSNPTPNRSANLLATGASANDILSNGSFDKLLIEIGYVSGFQPTVDAIDTLEEFIRARTFKEDVEFKYSPLSSPGEETLTLNEVAELERDNRTAYNDGSTLAIYIYFADAPSDSDDESEDLVTLGAVYRNTSMIIYESTVRDLASRSLSISVADLEAATLNHEFGHLLGLVNLGTDPVHPEHEDTEIGENDVETGNNHCNVDGCLMRAELQFGGPMVKSMQSNISKGLASVPQLDAECLLDLQNNGGR